MKHTATLLGVVASVALLGSCTGPGSALRANASRAYPESDARGQTLPVQVIRRVTHIEMTNTSAKAFGPSRVWLNARFSRTIDEFAVGQTLKLDLREFYDEFGESFRAGGFFATRNPEAMVLCELENEGTVYGLVVVGSLVD